MVKEFKLPDIGEGIHEGEIVRWLVKEGDTIAEDQPIAEVMTDKATVEITSPYSGRVARLNAGEGATVAVGATIIEIEDGAGGSSGAAAPAAEKPAEKPAAKAPDAPAKPAAREPAAQPSRPTAPEPVRSARTEPSAVMEVEPPAAASGKVLATPATRKLARELGVDIGEVRGSGAKGRVTREDIERATHAGAAPESTEAPAAKVVSSPAPRPPVSASVAGEEQRIPLRGLRKKIAEHMARSKRTAAHFTYVDEVDVTRLVKFRKEAKQSLDPQGVKLTYLPFIMKAIVGGLKKFPMLNASLDEAAGEIVVKHFYNFGIAVDTPAGLVVPVVRDVDRLSIVELAREVDRVASDARNGTVRLEDLRGGTFTITNAGNIGGLFATPVINFPEVAILGVHKIERRPVVRGEQIEIGDIMYLSISIDHRVVDGADGARFMNEVVRSLSDPGLLLLGA